MILTTLALLVVGLFTLIELGAIEYAYGKLGVSHRYLLPAYVAGTLGSLIGADLLNLRRVGAVGCPDSIDRRRRHVRRHLLYRGARRAARLVVEIVDRCEPPSPGSSRRVRRSVAE